MSVDNVARVAVAHRLRVAWRTFSGVHAQLGGHNKPLQLTIQFLEAIVFPSLLWGLERVLIQRRERGALRSVQRIIVSSCLRIFARPHEPRQEFQRRRERMNSATIKKHSRVDILLQLSCELEPFHLDELRS